MNPHAFLRAQDFKSCASAISPHRHKATLQPAQAYVSGPTWQSAISAGHANSVIAVPTTKDKAGVYYIEHVLKMFASPHSVEKSMQTCAEADGPETIVAYMQDPGSAAVAEAQATARALDGLNVRFVTASGHKETRAKPVSAQCGADNVKIVRGLWKDEFLRG